MFLSGLKVPSLSIYVYRVAVELETTSTKATRMPDESERVSEGESGRVGGTNTPPQGESSKLSLSYTALV